VITDPPYGTTRNQWDSVIPLSPMWESFARVGRDNAAFVFTASQPFTSSLVVSNSRWFRHEWVWIKNRGSNFANTVREPMKEHESVLVFSRGGWTYNKQSQERTGGGLDRVSYKFKPSTPTSNYGSFGDCKPEEYGELRVPSSWQCFTTETGLHPTQKPESLMAYLVATYSNEDELVLDSCCGSGTTLVAAAKLGRHFLGFEISPEYCSIARKRIALVEAQPNLFQPKAEQLTLESNQ
jgi:site-specific DNA-methyltransferase (adenine-specific)